jgi:hypothetical protein
MDSLGVMVTPSFPYVVKQDGRYVVPADALLKV